MSRKKKKSPEEKPLFFVGCSQFEFQTHPEDCDSDSGHIDVTRVVSENFADASSLLNEAWENARRIDWWARSGFVSHEDAAGVWAVAGDAAEDTGAVVPMEEAREYESSYKLFVGPLPPLLEGPLLPWPEVSRRFVKIVFDDWADYMPEGYDANTSGYGAEPHVEDNFPVGLPLPPAAVARVEFIGFPRVQIGPGEEVTVGVRAQIPMRLERIVIPSLVAFTLVVTNIRIGINSLLNGEVPAVLFTEDQMGQEFGQNFQGAVLPGQEIRVTLQNVSNVTQNVTCGGVVRVVRNASGQQAPAVMPMVEDDSIPLG